MNIAIALLIVIALYCYGMWGYIGFRYWSASRDRSMYLPSEWEAFRKTVFDETIKLGFTGTVALGFLAVAL